MNVEIKGIARTITDVLSKTSNNKTTRFQSLIVTIPGWTDSFGEKKGKDEDWEVQLINESIEKHNLAAKNLTGQKVIVKAWLNSRTYQANGEEKFMLQLNFASVEIFKPKE